MAANFGIIKKRGDLNKLAISGRQTKRSLWVLMQKYIFICKDVREHTMWVASFYCKDKKFFPVCLASTEFSHRLLLSF